MEAEGIQAEATETSLIPVGKPWGPWSTLGFSCIIGLISLAFTVALTLVYMIVSKLKNPKLDIMEFAESLDKNTDFYERSKGHCTFRLRQCVLTIQTHHFFKIRVANRHTNS